MTLEEAWKEYKKCYAKGDELSAEEDKLSAEVKKLHDEKNTRYLEGELIWYNTWIEHFGKDSRVNWFWGDKNA